MVVPTGPGDLELQLEMMLDFESTVLCATSSFALLIAETVEARGLTGKLSARVGIFGSERWGPKVRERIGALLGIEAFDIYGLTELYGPGTGIECAEHEGMHYWADYYVVEVVDPDTGEAVAAGEEGEIVLTTFRKEAMPLIRYRTRDLSFVYPEPCRCGSPYPRIGQLTGRTDDMVKVKGVAIFPAHVESVLARVEGVGSEYQLHVRREPGHGDVLLVRVEAEEREGLRGGPRSPAAGGALRPARGRARRARRAAAERAQDPARLRPPIDLRRRATPTRRARDDRRRRDGRDVRAAALPHREPRARHRAQRWT